MALEYASAALQGERDVVLAAVAKEARALQYTSAALQGDRDVVLAAVAQNGDALRYASEELKSDREILAAGGNTGSHPYGLEGWSIPSPIPEHILDSIALEEMIRRR